MIATAEEQECCWEEATTDTFSREKELPKLSQEAKDWEQLRALLPLLHHLMLTERLKLYL